MSVCGQTCPSTARRNIVTTRVESVEPEVWGATGVCVYRKVGVPEVLTCVTRSNFPPRYGARLHRKVPETYDQLVQLVWQT